MKLAPILLAATLASAMPTYAKRASERFPDGSRIPRWFSDTTSLTVKQQARIFDITAFGATIDSTIIQTAAIQRAIDAAATGGGTVLIPKGTFMSGALFFKPGTRLRVAEGGKLKGSADIGDYPKIPSRMEGQNLDYFAALVNAYDVDGFSISGGGVIDGNGSGYWDAFWQRRKENPKCTNLEVSRPRLVFIWGCKDVRVENVTLQNSGFWSSHYYQCERVKVQNVRITSPHEVQRAPSTDAIDLDICKDVLIRNCYLSVNDDAIALKGGKGPWADTMQGNGPNANIIIEDCTFGFCHSALTLGSESIHNRNVIMRNCKVDDAKRLLWLKMRPDTKQLYEYVTVANITGNVSSLLYIRPWKQFFDMQGRTGPLERISRHVTLRDINVRCKTFFDVTRGEGDQLADFRFLNLTVTAENPAIDRSLVERLTFSEVHVNGTELR